MNQALGIAVLVVVGAAAFQLGGAAPGAAPLLVAAVALLALIQAVRGARSPKAIEGKLAIVVGLASVPLLVAALELVPLSRGTIATLAPATARLYDRDDQAAGSGPTARTLSIEPGTSRRALERGVALLALFVLAARVARRSSDARPLALWLLVLGALVAVSGLGLSDTRTLGDEFDGRARSPFKNPNHFATFIEMILPLALGIALGASDEEGTRRPPPSLSRLGERPDLVVRLGAVACVALFVAAIFRSQSRAGILAAGLGSLAAIAGSRALTKGKLTAATALFVAAALGATWANARVPLSRINSARENLATRVDYWKLGLRVLEGRTLTGSGLGTYDATSFARLTSETASVLFLRPERAHNDYVNLASDLGVPAAIAATTAAALALLTIARRLRRLRSEQRGLAAGALGGAFAALVHAFFDFGLELAPLGALFAFVLGVGWAASAPEREPRGEEWEQEKDVVRGRAATRWIAAALLAPLVVLALRDFEAEREAASAGFDPVKPDSARLEPAKLEAARRLAPDDALLAAFEAHARRAKGLPGAIEAARAAVRSAPASATAQGELALALLEATTDHPELRPEGERRLAFARELGPSWGALHFAAGCYWIDRTAQTNDRAAAEAALAALRAAIRLQLSDQLAFRDAARLRIQEHLRQGRLGALGEEMLRDLARD